MLMVSPLCLLIIGFVDSSNHSWSQDLSQCKNQYVRVYIYLQKQLSIQITVKYELLRFHYYFVNDDLTM